jgi:hypothetical protein
MPPCNLKVADKSRRDEGVNWKSSLVVDRHDSVRHNWLVSWKDFGEELINLLIREETKIDWI